MHTYEVPVATHLPWLQLGAEARMRGEPGSQCSWRVPLSTPARPRLRPGDTELWDLRPSPSLGPPSTSPVAEHQSAGGCEHPPVTLTAVSLMRLAALHTGVRTHAISKQFNCSAVLIDNTLTTISTTTSYHLLCARHWGKCFTPSISLIFYNPLSSAVLCSR